MLTGTEEYEVEEEIVISRRLTIQGNPAIMPMIDAEESSRAFRVVVSRSRNNPYLSPFGRSWRAVDPSIPLPFMAISQW